MPALPGIFTLIVFAAAAFAQDNGLTIGLTRSGSEIKAYANQPQAPTSRAPAVIVIGAPLPSRTPKGLRVIAVPQPNPDGAQLVFPPQGRAYRDNPESHYLWRWIAMQAPD